MPCVKKYIRQLLIIIKSKWPPKLNHNGQRLYHFLADCGGVGFHVLSVCRPICVYVWGLRVMVYVF